MVKKTLPVINHTTGLKLNVLFVQAMWLMLQQDTPEDFVISTGIAHSVREFVVAAFKHIGQEIV